MSAFLCGQEHINALVNWANRRSPYGGMSLVQRLEVTPQELGELLYNENVRSLQARYGNDHDSYKYKFRQAYNVTPVQILKACSCYDYQACESEDYETTNAAKVIDQIRQSAIAALPGYDDAQWEITKSRLPKKVTID